MSTEQALAAAGTLESGDALISVSPGEKGKVSLELESIVMAQYGEAIEEVLRKTLEEAGVTGISLKVSDRGAFDCTLRARLLTALQRGGWVKEVRP